VRKNETREPKKRKSAKAEKNGKKEVGAVAGSVAVAVGAAQNGTLRVFTRHPQRKL
jgi:hypothetical protein